MYDFNKVVNRINTNSTKYDALEARFGRKDLLPFWIADMEFEAPDFITDSIIARAKNGVFGYSKRGGFFNESVKNWMGRRHGWNINPNWVEYIPGVLPAITLLIRMLTEVNDKIIIQSPVYYPFFNIIRRHEREILDNGLIEKEGRYVMDFNDLELKARDPKCKVLLLSNPHNPVGRVWTKEELTRVCEICHENDVYIISDEIHFDLVFEGYKHVPIASLSDKYIDKIITCTAPSKTFNIAGIHSAYCIISDEELRAKFASSVGLLDIETSNVFSLVVTEAVLNKGDLWLDELLEYLKENRDFVINYLDENVPKIKAFKNEGTYLMWLDCRQMNMNRDELDDFFINDAKLALNSGYSFGDAGEGFMRLNIACPLSKLEEALERLKNAFD